MKRSVQINANFSDYTQDEFLNFINYFIFGNLSNFKIWRLSKNTQTFVLAMTCAIFYIHCVCPAWASFDLLKGK